MLRMEIALFLVLGFVAYMYDSVERTRMALHRTFSALLAATLVHLVFDALTLYTMNHLVSVPKWLNDGLQRLFVGTMVLVVYLFYQYIAILVEEESGKPRKLDLAARVYLAVAEAGVLPLGNYSDGIHADVCYVSVGVYLLLCAAQLAMEGGRSMKLLRVLLVDDEIMIREGFKRLFDWQAHGCEVVSEAADGVQALSQMEELKPDIVVMDINIPLMNGLKVISLWRMRSETTAFVIVSGYDDFSYCQEALKLPSTDYLLKPVDYEEFGACIDHLRIALFEKGAARADTIGEGEKTIWSLTRYLQEHLSEEISLNLLADVFHLNPQYIGQLFKNEIGVNFLSYLTNIRMERAEKLLVSTDLPVSEVAQRSGYADYRVFTKAFKKAEGVTPSQYRQDF